MRVIEIWPGGGWYTEVLAPWLKGDGKLVVAVQDPADPDLPKFEIKMIADYKAIYLVGYSQIYQMLPRRSRPHAAARRVSAHTARSATSKHATATRGKRKNHHK